MKDLILLTLFPLFVLPDLHAQSTVTAIRVNGQNAASAQVTVLPSGNGTSRKSINVNEQLGSGTKLIIPSGVQLALRSPGGSQIVAGTKGKTIEYTVEMTPKGENHTVSGLGARIANKVSKTAGYNYKNSNGGGSTAAAKGTEFSFTDNSEGGSESATIATTEGSIHIIDEVPVMVNGQIVQGNHGATTKSNMKVQSAGEQFTTSDQPVTYSSFEDAIQAIQAESNRELDEEEWADDEFCIGELYAANHQLKESIPHYRNAIQFYTSAYGEDDLENTLDAKLSLADALIQLENPEGNALIKECITALEEQLDDAREDLHFLADDEDEAAFACDDVMEIAGMLADAYRIESDTENANKYEALSTNCKN